MMFRYSLQGKELALVQYEGRDPVVSIPESFRGRPVRVVGPHAFSQAAPFLKRVEIPSSVREISPCAFESCFKLQEVTLSEGLQHIGQDAFHDTAVQSLFIPSTVSSIGRPEECDFSLVFSEQNPYYRSDGTGIYRVNESGGMDFVCFCRGIRARHYDLDGRCTAIRASSFFRSGPVRSIGLPASVRLIEEGALTPVKQGRDLVDPILDIRVDPENPFFFTEKGALYRHAQDGLHLVKYFVSDKEPSLRDDLEVIESYAFTGKQIDQLVVPQSVRAIHESAFRCCRMQSAIIHGKTKILLPSDNPYLMEDLLSAFGEEDKVYDFPIMDRILSNAYLDFDRIRMILNRLSYPEELSPQAGEGFQANLRKKFDIVLHYVTASHALDCLKKLVEYEIIDASNIDQALQAVRSSGDAQMTAYLMRCRADLHPKDQETMMLDN